MIHTPLSTFAHEYTTLLMQATGYAAALAETTPGQLLCGRISLDMVVESIDGRLEVVALVGTHLDLGDAPSGPHVDALTTALRVLTGSRKLRVKFSNIRRPVVALRTREMQ